MQSFTGYTDDRRPELPDELARMPFMPFWSGCEEFNGQSGMSAPGTSPVTRRPDDQAPPATWPASSSEGYGRARRLLCLLQLQYAYSNPTRTPHCIVTMPQRAF